MGDASAGVADVCVDHGGLAHARHGLTGAGLYLVRPDGHVAFRAPSLDAAPLAAYLDRVLPVCGDVAATRP